MGGFVKLQRDALKLLEEKPSRFLVYSYLVLRASFLTEERNGYTLERGQVISSLNEIAEACRLSKWQVREAVEYLKGINIISAQKTAQKTARKETVLTICNYDGCGYAENENSHDVPHDVPHDSQRKNEKEQKERTKEKEEKEKIENIQEIKESKKEKASLAPRTPQKEDISLREERFRDEVALYRGQYTDEMLIAFFCYWSEANKSKTKMRYELQPTWDLSKRLSTWNRKSYEKNIFNFSSNKRTAEFLQRQQGVAQLLHRLTSQE